ncbi:hypothetical protein Dimus_034274 [Dionaea muscipula]
MERNLEKKPIVSWVRKPEGIGQCTVRTGIEKNIHEGAVGLQGNHVTMGDMKKGDEWQLVSKKQGSKPAAGAFNTWQIALALSQFLSGSEMEQALSGGMDDRSDGKGTRRIFFS